MVTTWGNIALQMLILIAAEFGNSAERVRQKAIGMPAEVLLRKHPDGTFLELLLKQKGYINRQSQSFFLRYEPCFGYTHRPVIFTAPNLSICDSCFIFQIKSHTHRTEIIDDNSRRFGGWNFFAVDYPIAVGIHIDNGR